MNLRAIPEKLQDPEYYMEYELKDVRLAVSKINDFIETLGDASLSLIYSNKEEHPNVEERALNIVRRIHIRHAIIDLNNSFDILLQVPWFLYRGWKEFNKGGKYAHPKRKAKNDIVRNNGEWVEKVEDSCSYSDLVMKFLKRSTDPNLNTIAHYYEDFNAKFRFNTKKRFTVRSIANQLKHKNNIKLKEFYDPYDFNMIVNEKELKLKELKLSEKDLCVEIKQEFYDMETNIKHGQIIARYIDDLEIDIEYNSGEKFFGKDLVNQRKLYSIDELLSEMENYFNSTIELYNNIYNVITNEIQRNPFMKEPHIRNTNEYNMDKFFKSK